MRVIRLVEYKVRTREMEIEVQRRLDSWGKKPSLVIINNNNNKGKRMRLDGERHPIGKKGEKTSRITRNDHTNTHFLEMQWTKNEIDCLYRLNIVCSCPFGI